jgi:hypothetical protein
LNDKGRLKVKLLWDSSLYLWAFDFRRTFEGSYALLFTLKTSKQPEKKFLDCYTLEGYAVAQLDEALRYMAEGRGFDSRWFHWNFSLT